MVSNAWGAIDDALSRTAARGHAIEIWLRDDDAIAETASLRRLVTVCEMHDLPILLAVIPEQAEESLASFVLEQPLLTPTQHGYNHANHAPPGERARELGGTRSLDSVIADLERGRAKLDRMFGPRKADILVPPWNRIDDSVLPRLPGLGFGAISTFGLAQHTVPGLETVNCNLDPIDWRNGRRCHAEEKLIGKLIGLIETGQPIGLLTHHLAHDEATWTFLHRTLDRFHEHPAVQFTSADALRSRCF